MKYLLAAVAVAPLIAGMAHAQDQAEDEVRIEQTVIVTLPGPQRTAGELVSNVAALDRKEIVEALASTLGKAQAGLFCAASAPNACRC